ncbi:uncharacterized protein NPIL_508221 [Nephila pilipes]|uniref:Uncharacterized protein n=1 Tax=Nephila pilipes TaxID=299642 RepID=A0A8X6MYS3_NEPPI|nr:uncharacterized protein NPIL_508221 [Nephila pilipes]
MMTLKASVEVSKLHNSKNEYLEFNMIAGFLIAAFIIQGNEGKVAEDNCDVSRFSECYSMSPEEFMHDKFRPSKEKLEKYCPSLLEMANCFQDFTDECKNNNDELFGVYTYDINFIKELCNKQSVLRNDYLQNAECYQSLKPQFSQCGDDGSNAYNHYIDSIDYKDDSKEKYHQSCLTAAYGLACVISSTDSTCGGTAFRAFFEMEKLKESIVFTKYFCSHIDFDKEVEYGFFTTLKIPENQKSSFNEVLDYLKEQLIANDKK